MAFILRNTKLIYNVVGFACKSGRFTNKSRRVLFVERPDIINCKDFRIRYKVSLAQQETEQENESQLIEKAFYQLNIDIKRRNVLMKDLETTLKEVQKKGEISNFEIMLLLRCCTKVSFMSTEKERVDMARNIWQTAEKLGVQFNISHYNALLDVFLENNHSFSPSEFLDNLTNAGIAPNIHTYRRLLKAFCQQGDLNGASNLLNKMKEVDYRLNEMDFNTMIIGYSNTGELDKAEEIIQVMESKNVAPTSQTYVNLLCGYAKHGLVEKLNDTLKELPCKEIFLSEPDMLEILYALAVNNHGDQAEGLLQEIVKGSESNEYLSKFLHRLFHKKLDSLALKILDLIAEHKKISFTAIYSKYILDHFISYRTPKEILEICNFLESKGMARVPLSYTLKTIFLNKDEEFMLKFFDTMKRSDIEVRKHYYWPGIIKASEKGNSCLLNYLGEIPKFVLNHQKTLADYIFPRYQFGKSWQKDMDLLCRVGIHEGFVARHLLETFLLKQQVNEVLEIASSFPVYIYRTNHILNILSNFQKNNPDKVKEVVDVIYKLAHDYKKFETNTMNTFEITNFFNAAVKSLVNENPDEEVVVHFLENMLKKQMNIAASVGAHVLNLYKSKRVEELVEKLTNPDLKFQMNQDLLSIKKWNDFSSGKSWVSKENQNFGTLLPGLIDLITEEKYDQALKLCERLYSQKKEFTPDNFIQKRFRLCYLTAAKKGNVKLTEKLFEVGVSLEFLKQDDFFPLIRSILISKNIPEAVDKYCEFVLQHGNLTGCVELLSELVSQENTEGCQKVVNLVTDIRNKNTGLSVLVCAFVKTGNFEKAQKVLGEPAIFRPKYISVDNGGCLILRFEFNFRNAGLHFVFKDWLYKLLVSKYVEEKKVEKLMEFWPKIQMKRALDQHFLKQYASFVENPSVERLNVFSFLEMNRLNWDESEKLKNENNVGTSAKVNTKQYSANRTQDLIRTSVSEGNFSELVKLIEDSPDNSKLIGNILFDKGKVEEYFKLVETFASKNELGKISLILYPFRLLPFLNNDDHYRKYKSLAIQCFEKGVTEPFIFCVAASMLRPEKIEEAINMLEQHSSRFNLNEISFTLLQKIFLITRYPRVKFAEVILSNEKLKDKFSNHLPQFYSSLFAKHCKNDDMKSFVRYLNMAKADGALDSITNVELLALMKKKLKQHNINFSLGDTQDAKELSSN